MHSNFNFFNTIHQTCSEHASNVFSPMFWLVLFIKGAQSKDEILEKNKDTDDPVLHDEEITYYSPGLYTVKITNEAKKLSFSEYTTVIFHNYPHFSANAQIGDLFYDTILGSTNIIGCNFYSSGTISIASKDSTTDCVFSVIQMSNIPCKTLDFIIGSNFQAFSISENGNFSITSNQQNCIVYVSPDELSMDFIGEEITENMKLEIYDFNQQNLFTVNKNNQIAHINSSMLICVWNTGNVNSIPQKGKDNVKTSMTISLNSITRKNPVDCSSVNGIINTDSSYTYQPYSNTDINGNFILAGGKYTPENQENSMIYFWIAIGVIAALFITCFIVFQIKHEHAGIFFRNKQKGRSYMQSNQENTSRHINQTLNNSHYHYVSQEFDNPLLNSHAESLA